MKNLKIVPIEKREPSDKERYLSELINHVEKLQNFLTSVNRQGDLWILFNYLSLLVGSFETESIEGKGYERYRDKYDENGRIIKKGEERK